MRTTIIMLTLLTASELAATPTTQRREEIGASEPGRRAPEPTGAEVFE